MSTYFLVKKKHLKTTIITHASVTEIPLNAACSKQSQKPTSNQNGFRAENAVVTNSHTGFIQQPLLPPPNFSLTKFYMFCKQPVGNGLLKTVPLMTTDFMAQGVGRKTQSDSYWVVKRQSHRSLGKAHAAQHDPQSSGYCEALHQRALVAFPYSIIIHNKLVL